MNSVCFFNITLHAAIMHQSKDNTLQDFQRQIIIALEFIPFILGFEVQESLIFIQLAAEP